MSAQVLCDLKNNLWWTARRKFTVNDSILKRDDTEAPDTAQANIGGDFVSSTAALNIETATVPRTVIVTVLTVLRLSFRAVCPRPLCRQISLCD